MNSVANVPYAHAPAARTVAPTGRDAVGDPRAPVPAEDDGSPAQPRLRRLSDPRAGQAHALFTYGRAATLSDHPGRGVHVDTFA